MLTADDLRKHVSYDAKTGLFKRLVPHKRMLANVPAGSLRPTGYVSVNILGRLYQAHRLAWLYVHGQWPAKYIDHINGDKSDNRITNLREASQSQNIANSKLSSANKVGLKGVSFDRKKNRYRASIVRNGKQTFLGYFSDPHEAHSAYAAAARHLHGEFARAN